MGGISNGVINQVAQGINQPQAQQPQYGQQQPNMMGGGLGGLVGRAVQAINQPQAQQLQFNQQPSGMMGGGLGGLVGRAVQAINQQTMGMNPQATPQMQGNVNQNPMLPNQMAYGDGLNAPSMQSEVMSGSPFMGRQPLPMGATFDRPMDGSPTRGFPPNVPMSGAPLQGMGAMAAQMTQQPFGSGQQFNQRRFDRMEDRMQRFQDNGRNVPQGFQRRYEQMKSMQTQTPVATEQQRLAKALRGE